MGRWAPVHWFPLQPLPHSPTFRDGAQEPIPRSLGFPSPQLHACLPACTASDSAPESVLTILKEFTHSDPAVRKKKKKKKGTVLLSRSLWLGSGPREARFSIQCDKGRRRGHEQGTQLGLGPGRLPGRGNTQAGVHRAGDGMRAVSKERWDH